MSESTSKKEAKSDTPEKVVECRVLVKKLELPHGVAAKGVVVRLKYSDYQEHKKDGNVQFLKYVS